MNFYKDKKVLVTGGTGLIGIPLVKKLVNAGAYVNIAAADPFDRFHMLEGEIEEFKEVYNYTTCDLTDYRGCYGVCEGMDYVFQLAGSKGAGTIGTSKAATFLTSHLLINLNMLKAAHARRVEKYLLTSTVGVYSPDSSYKEDENIFNNEPAAGDKYSSWAKRISELTAEAFMKEYQWSGIVIVRPGSVYGPWDNFDQDTAMVVGSLINKFDLAEGELLIKAPYVRRDFTFADDVAESMMIALEKSGNCEVFNLSSGLPYSIQALAKCIQEAFKEHGKNVELIYEDNFINTKRVLNGEKTANVLDFITTRTLYEGIKQTVDWYIKNKSIVNIRYNAFKEN